MSENQPVAVQVNNLTKTFKIPTEASSGIKQKLINGLKGKKGYREFTPLKDISFEIRKGDFFGIVGRNGSGKSTLLKSIANIYTPTSGQVHVDGRLVPFIELGVGFNPELTGRENIFLNGALLGFSRSEMEAMYDEIVAFAEIGDFMEEKLKNYSSGMQVRLAFAIAIQADADILLLDEVLAVGDEAFQRKCNEYFASLKNSDKTVVLVTHDMAAVRKFCNRAVYIRNGELVIDGTPDDVASQYSIDNYKKNKDKDSTDGEYPPGLSALVPSFSITPQSKQVLTSKDTFELSVQYEVTEDIPIQFGISMLDEDAGAGLSVFDDYIKSGEERKTVSTKKGTYKFDYEIPLSRFNNRNFVIKGELYKVVENERVVIASTNQDNVCRFSIRGEKHDGGLLKEKGKWIKSV